MVKSLIGRGRPSNRPVGALSDFAVLARNWSGSSGLSSAEEHEVHEGRIVDCANRRLLRKLRPGINHALGIGNWQQGADRLHGAAILRARRRDEPVAHLLENGAGHLFCLGSPVGGTKAPLVSRPEPLEHLVLGLPQTCDFVRVIARIGEGFIDSAQREVVFTGDIFWTQPWRELSMSSTRIRWLASFVTPLACSRC